MLGTTWAVASVCSHHTMTPHWVDSHRLCCPADDAMNKHGLIYFSSWNTVVLAITGILGTVVSVREMSSNFRRAASPRKSGQLHKHHRSELDFAGTGNVVSDVHRVENASSGLAEHALLLCECPY